MRSRHSDISGLQLACATVGLGLEALSPALLARLRLLARHSETTRDGQRICDMARRVFAQIQADKPGLSFTPDEEQIVILGSLFADIGKTGPAHADADGQRLIVEMFAVEGVRDDQQTVAQFLRSYFPADAESRAQGFRALGLDPSMTMRAFWNEHAGWSLDILRDGGLPEEAVAAAATHHLLDNVNPDSIVDSNGHYSQDFGNNLGFDRAEKLVILLDKYDALRRRAKRSHAEAIGWLQGLLDQHQVFRNDAELRELLRDMDKALSGAPVPSPENDKAP